MRIAYFAAFFLICCQPIVIGTPGGAAGDEPDGTSGSLNGGTSANNAGASTTGGSSTTNTGGATTSGGVTTSGGANPGGSASNLSDAGSSLGGAGTTGNGGEAGSDVDGGGAGSDVDGGGAGGSPEIGDPVAPPLTAHVMIVAYNPLINGEGEAPETLAQSLALKTPGELAEELGAQLEVVTQGHVHYLFPLRQSPLAFPPTENGIRQTPATYEACLADASNCGAAADYNSTEAENQICNAVSDTEIDQVWLLGGKNFGFSVGKQLSCQVLGHALATQLDVVSLDYSEGMKSLLASYQQHSQYALTEAFGVPAAIATADSPNNTYGLLVQAQGRSFEAPASGCGDITFAPNSLSPHRFDDLREAPSYCESFLRSPRPAPLSALLPTSCSAWGCTEAGFRDYWFLHLPRAPWSDEHDMLNDFWPYILHPAARLPPPLTSVTCSSSYMPGWCEHAIDGTSGVCNEHEWASSKGQTGFVELRFVPPRLISSVTLFDRACIDDQVQAGHLEFSDGSEPRGFGQLPDDAKTAITTSFPPKLLSGLRVVIDFSTGYRSGFGDIQLSSDLPP